MNEEIDIEQQPDDDRPPATDDSINSRDNSSSEENNIPSEEAPQCKTTNPQQQTPDMEVHHHGHVHEHKKWKEYLFQFLMLFLAVFCGFLAEYQLEHKIEKDREKVFIKSFYEDLTADEYDLQRVIDNLSRDVQISDSLFLWMDNISVKTPANLIYMHLRSITRGSATRLYVNDRTIVQLRNSGGMRLIQNKSVSDSIVRYYKDVENIQFLNEEALILKRSLREDFPAILNATDFAKVVDSTNRIVTPSETLYLRSADENSINKCLLLINNIKGLSSGVRNRIQQLKIKASRIKAFIQEKYHFE